MFRYYKVPVYELQEDLVSYNQLDCIAVTPYHLFAKELLTGYFSINYIKEKEVDYYSSSCSSNLTSTSLGLDPLGGPIIPLSSNKSIIRAALL